MDRPVFARLSLVAMILGAALSASAVDAFSNLEGTYDKTGSVVSPYATVGFRFASALTGPLTGFRASMNNLSTTDGAPRAFAFSLYTSTADDRLGTLLGSYAGLSTGKAYNRAKKEIASVAASGPTLTAGTSYWLVATSQEQLVWNWVDHGVTMPTTYTISEGAANYGNYNAGAFSVQVGSASRVNPVPESASMAALGLGVLALVRRRRS